MYDRSVDPLYVEQERDCMTEEMYNTDAPQSTIITSIEERVHELHDECPRKCEVVGVKKDNSWNGIS